VIHKGGRKGRRKKQAQLTKLRERIEKFLLLEEYLLIRKGE